MPMHNGESVGDMIVRNRKLDLASPHTSPRMKAEILARPAPRTMERETWPPSSPSGKKEGKKK